MVQAQAGGGLEFYVGVIVDERFGLMVIVGGGGPEVENRSDVAIARCPISQDAILRLIGETAAGRWLSTPAVRGLVDLESLAMVAHRGTLVAVDLGGDFSTLDLNPVVVGPAGAIVVNAEDHCARAGPPGTLGWRGHEPRHDEERHAENGGGVTIDAIVVDGPADGVARVTFNRPKVLNAINRDFLDGLDAALSELEADDSVSCVDSSRGREGPSWLALI